MTQHAILQTALKRRWSGPIHTGDLVAGLEIGALTYRRPTANRINGAVVHEWSCECGAIVQKTLPRIAGTRTPSCGCIRIEAQRHAQLRHGCSLKKNGDPGYQTFICWQSMLWRCNNSARKDYPAYGGRGITVCAEWSGSFERFVSDMGMKPDGMSIDRIDTNGNYEPGNCRWASPTTQANNKRTNRFLEHGGERLTIAQWAKRLGMGRDTLRLRIEAGWSVEAALETPLRKMAARVKAYRIEVKQ